MTIEVLGGGPIVFGAPNFESDKIANVSSSSP
jgi:hypothetical protein